MADESKRKDIDSTIDDLAEAISFLYSYYKSIISKRLNIVNGKLRKVKARPGFSRAFFFYLESLRAPSISAFLSYMMIDIEFPYYFSRIRKNTLRLPYKIYSIIRGLKST